MFRRIIQYRCSLCGPGSRDEIVALQQPIPLLRATCVRHAHNEAEIISIEHEPITENIGVSQADIDAWIQEQEQAETTYAQQQREEAENELRERIREIFFSTSLAATEEDFSKLYPQLRERYLTERTMDRLNIDDRLPVAGRFWNPNQ